MIPATVFCLIVCSPIIVGLLECLIKECIDRLKVDWEELADSFLIDRIILSMQKLEETTKKLEMKEINNE